MSDNIILIFAIGCLAAAVYFLMQAYTDSKKNFPKGSIYQYIIYAIALLILSASIYFKFLNEIPIIIVGILFYVGIYVNKNIK